MKLASFTIDGRAAWGMVDGDAVVDCSARFPTLRMALASGDIAKATTGGGPRHALSAVAFLPVIPDPQKILCIGLNYRDHAAEAKRDAPDKYPTVFVRFPPSQTGHLQPLLRPEEAGFFDYEGEIAVIIGKGGRRISEADAWSHIAGYAPYNDGSVRDWQGHASQWTAGKNFDRTGGFGPWMVTRDEIPDGATMTLQTRVDGKTVQSSSSDNLIFSFPRLIAYISSFTTLEPGDVIITGTPAGVGKFRDPQVPLVHGSVVEIEVGRVGVLRNTVQDDPAR
jgi:2-keto-4-pentenoate hydratase/2-oxohepta-3-ene-1,7-dioic acid hydratase in catechol pathway